MLFTPTNNSIQESYTLFVIVSFSEFCDPMFPGVREITVSSRKLLILMDRYYKRVEQESKYRALIVTSNDHFIEAYSHMSK
jgi:hypothetical protein